MSIKVKAVERNVSFDKSNEKWAYVMQPELYSKLTQNKVIQEAFCFPRWASSTVRCSQP